MVAASRALAVLLCALFVDTVALADGAGEVDFYLHAVLAERQKLRSGTYTVRGSRAVKDSQVASLSVSGKVTIFCAFDESNIRMDNVEGVFSASPAEPLKANVTTVERRYYRTTEESGVWSETKDTAWIAQPDAPLIGRFLFLDVRALGVMTWIYVTDTRGSRLEETIAAYSSVAREKSVEKDGDLVQLVFATDFPASREELRLWIAPEQGFTATRLETRSRIGDATSGKWQVNERTTISWKQVAGVWVPTTCAMKRFQGTAEETLDLTFDWQAVNQSVDSKYFTLAGLEVPRTTTVVDMTRGDPLVIRDPREETVEIVDDFMLRWLLIGANVAVIGCFLFFLLRRRRRLRVP